MKSFQLKSGITLPWIGIGTDGFTSNEETQQSLQMAINHHYQLIDSATGYSSYETVADVVQKNNRKNLILCVKFNGGDLKRYTVKELFEKISDDFKTKYIDILLMHNTKIGDLKEICTNLIDLKKEKKIFSLGVSNFAVKHFSLIEDFIEHIDINQIEFHPFLFQKELYDFCQNNSIHIMGYRPEVSSPF
jgi:diketogulonate reductase-like aldo/keto reductase